MPKIDCDKTPDVGTFETLPDGTYTVCVENCTEKVTQAGFPQFQIEFVVLDEHAKGRRLRDNITFMDGPAMQRTKFVLHRLGFKTEGVLNVEARELIGRECFVVCSGTKEYNGKTYNVIPFDGYRAKEDEVF
jgi:hypothetical protein